MRYSKVSVQYSLLFPVVAKILHRQFASPLQRQFQLGKVRFRRHYGMVQGDDRHIFGQLKIIAPQLLDHPLGYAVG